MRWEKQKYSCHKRIASSEPANGTHLLWWNDSPIPCYKKLIIFIIFNIYIKNNHSVKASNFSKKKRKKNVTPYLDRVNLRDRKGRIGGENVFLSSYSFFPFFFFKSLLDTRDFPSTLEKSRWRERAEVFISSALEPFNFPRAVRADRIIGLWILDFRPSPMLSLFLLFFPLRVSLRVAAGCQLLGKKLHVPLLLERWKLKSAFTVSTLDSNIDGRKTALSMGEHFESRAPSRTLTI